MNAKCAFALSAALLVSFFPSALRAQGLTGQVSGSVQDPAGAAVTGARISLINAGTGQARESTTDGSGAFVFTELLPGAYQISVEVPGFKRYEQKDMNLSSGERVTLRQITLELGQVSETLSVTAEAARLQTQSAERSGLITNTQIKQLALKGRDYLGLVRLLPGVVDSANREAPGFNSIQGININGAREHTINLTLDGVSNLDTGSMSGPFISPSLDAIGEVKVLLTNYQAEYGRSSGGTINVVVKNGTKDFHGVAYYFIRNDALNANEYFNNQQGLRKPRYHYNDAGYTIGGPVIIPKITRNRNKLFFFWSEEFIPRKEPQPQLRRTFPTTLERQGNFSQTLDTNGRVIPIMDPLNNRVAFPGNVIPANRIDKGGQGLLNVFPLPNVRDPNNTFNNAFQNIVDHPWRQELLRLDWNVSSNTLFYIRMIETAEAFKSAMDTNLGARNWPQFPTNYKLTGMGLVTTLIHTFSPTLVNEFTFG
ncbi:MAG: TonB-dependent receptor, partial [Bryobacteraceae bacterium]